MINRLLLVTLLSSAALFGCKKKAADAGAGSGSDSGSAAAAPAGSGSAAPTPTPTPAAGSGSAAAAAPAGSAAAPAAGAIANDEEFTKHAKELTDKLIAAIKDAHDDCDKVGDGMAAVLDGNKAEIEAVGAYAKAHPDDKRDEAQAKAMLDQVGPVLEKCQDNAKVKAAGERMAKM